MVQRSPFRNKKLALLWSILACSTAHAGFVYNAPASVVKDDDKEQVQGAGKFQPDAGKIVTGQTNQVTDPAAIAALLASESKSKARVLVNNQYKPVIEVGAKASGVAARSRGEMRLTDALTLVLPDGWKAAAAPKIDVAQIVSWDVRGIWTDTLAQIGGKSSLEFIVNHNTKTVTVRESSLVGESRFAQRDSARGTVPSIVEVTPLETSSPLNDHDSRMRRMLANSSDAPSTTSQQVSQTSSSQITPVADPTPAPLLTYSVQRGDSWSMAVQRVSAMYGYTAYWQASTDVAGSPGTFTDPTALGLFGKLAQSANARACVYTNRTIVFKNSGDSCQ